MRPRPPATPRSRSPTTPVSTTTSSRGGPPWMRDGNFADRGSTVRRRSARSRDQAADVPSAVERSSHDRSRDDGFGRSPVPRRAMRQGLGWLPAQRCWLWTTYVAACRAVNQAGLVPARRQLPLGVAEQPHPSRRVPGVRAFAHDQSRTSDRLTLRRGLRLCGEVSAVTAGTRSGDGGVPGSFAPTASLQCSA